MVYKKKDKSDGNCCSTLHFNCTWVPINVQSIFLHYKRTVTCCPKRMGEHFVPSCEVSRTVSVVSTPAASSQVGEVLDVASLPQGQAHGAGCHGCGVGAVLSMGTPRLTSTLCCVCATFLCHRPLPGVWRCVVLEQRVPLDTMLFVEVSGE